MLEKLNLKWEFSTTKDHFIRFKVTVILNEKTRVPVSILIHSEAPNDSKIFDKVLQDLQKRHITKRKDIILFNRGYYRYKSYQIGINKYKIVPHHISKRIIQGRKIKRTNILSNGNIFKK
ncbi:transposase [uncultured Methanobrevibacter sp.]|uniref:transposase n=1 Tax=uncultured Methanobrevibacter sp. TaxID=253161 RepID=UPI00343CCFB8